MSTVNPHLQVNAVSRDEGQFRIRRVLSGTQTLTAAQSGSLCLFSAAAGSVFTLPTVTADQIGTWFDFQVTVTVTSNSHTVITGTPASQFILGSVLQAIEDTTPAANPGPKDFVFNGSTHVKCAMNGSTTGGIIGTTLRIVAISTTVWLISGYVKASGTIATPAATA
jgi:hypothetical protein